MSEKLRKVIAEEIEIYFRSKKNKPIRVDINSNDYSVTVITCLSCTIKSCLPTQISNIDLMHAIDLLF